MRNAMADEIRRLHKKIATADRRLAISTLSGKVAQVDPDKRRLRLSIGKTAEGEDILGPWVRWSEPASGGMRIHSQPAIGEQMTMISASGTVGEASVATPGTYDKDHAAPSNSSDTAVFERGGGRIEIGPDGVRIIGNFEAEGGSFMHNKKNVGHDHEHLGVMPGGGTSGPPA